MDELAKKEIRAICDFHGYPEHAEYFITNNWTPQRVLAIAMGGSGTSKRPSQTASHFADRTFRPDLYDMTTDKGKFRAAAVDAIAIRGGISVQKPAPGARELMSYSLVELARECLRKAGQPTNGPNMQLIGRAMTTSDFPSLLADVANKSLFEGYNTASETWRVWCGTGQASDFKPGNIVKVGESDELDEIPEKGKYRYGEQADSNETYQLATYGKIFPISRRVIINDDVEALTTIPRSHGEAGSRKIGDVVYAVLEANAAMGDGITLFHSNHGNVGTGGAPSETTISEAIKLMKLQKDIGGKRHLNIQPSYFLGPVEIEGSAEVFFNSILFASDNKAATRNNPYAGSFFTRVYEPRLDDVSSTAWYLLGPKGVTVKVFFLHGVEDPYLETREGWTVDGVEYKVRIDAAAKAVDWKAFVYNAGA